VVGEPTAVHDASTSDRANAWPTLDVVIPMYNEARVLPALLRSLGETFAPEMCRHHRLSHVTCIFVDDGSRDGSVQIVQASRPATLGVRIVRLSRNFGHQAAVTAGIANSCSDLVTVIDADLQDPPPFILEMIKKWRSGCEVVHAIRRNRKEGRVKVALYWCFYRFYRLLTPIDVPVDSGDFCLMSRRVVDELNRLPEKVRFPRGLRSWVGFRQETIAYDRPPRFAGETRYTFMNLYQLATEGIASLSLLPLKVAQVLSLLFMLLTAGGVTLLGLGLFHATDVRAQISFLTILMLLSNSVILFCLYILGAYLGRAYLEIKGRPSYIVAEIIQPDAAQQP
jgi:dolichol-phosphate mannosyltransferase